MRGAVRPLFSRPACYSHHLPLSSCWDTATGWNNASIIHRPFPASKEQRVGSLSRLNPTLSHLSLTLTCRLERGAHTTQEVLNRTWVHPRRSHIGHPFALNILEICLSSDADVAYTSLVLNSEILLGFIKKHKHDPLQLPLLPSRTHIREANALGTNSHLFASTLQASGRFHLVSGSSKFVIT